MLSPSEVSDLFAVSYRLRKLIDIAGRINPICSPQLDALVLIQDGSDAGQTIPHVHLHIIPREIMPSTPMSTTIAMNLEDTRPIRSLFDMETEANVFRQALLALEAMERGESGECIPILLRPVLTGENAATVLHRII